MSAVWNRLFKDEARLQRTEAETAALRDEAQAAALRGDLATRIALLERLTATATVAPEDQTALVETLSEARRFRDAEAALGRFLAEAPGDRRLLLELGVLLQGMDRWGACCEALAGMAHDPDPGSLSDFLLGLNYQWLGLYAESAEAFARLPAHCGAYWDSERKRANDSLAAAERSAAEEPPGSAAQLTALATLNRRDAFEAGLAALDDAQRRSPEMVAARARFALRDGGVAASAALYDKACADDPSVALRIDRARHLADAGRTGDAIDILRGIPEDERPFTAWSMLARQLLLAGEIGPPEGFAESFLTRFPGGRESTMTYVLAALEAGVISRFVEPPAAPQDAALAVPIVQFWHGEPLPDMLPVFESWRQQNPGLRHELFDQPRARAFLAEHYGEETASLFDECYHPAMKSDFFRLAYLFRHGGIYTDADELCLRPLAPVVAALADCECLLFLRTSVLPYINNSFIAARAGSRVIGEALRDVTEALRAARREGRQTDIWFTTGPGALTRAAANALRRSAPGEDAQRLMRLFTERHLMTYTRTMDALEYKTKPEGDWRLSSPPARQKLATVFAAKYEAGSDWGGYSGFGSSPPHMTPYIAFVQQFIHLNQVRSVVDVGCGDWLFSRFINFGDATYTGYEVVPALVERNRALYGSERVRFELMPEDPSQLPAADLLLCKDVLQHLPTAMIQDMLGRMLPQFRFALITNSHSKLGAAPVNEECDIGGFRPLDLTAPPFDLAGSYVLEFPSAFWELLRTLLVVRQPR